MYMYMYMHASEYVCVHTRICDSLLPLFWALILGYVFGPALHISGDGRCVWNVNRVSKSSTTTQLEGGRREREGGEMERGREGREGRGAKEG